MAASFDADALFQLTKKGLAFFNDLFDFPYPWGKYEQAFVPEYNLGAMENPGLVTFTKLRLHLPGRRFAVPGPRQHAPARDGAHVVRGPRHHEVVG